MMSIDSPHCVFGGEELLFLKNIFEPQSARRSQRKNIYSN